MKKDRTNLIFIITILIALSFAFFLVLFFGIIQKKNNYTSEVLTAISNRINERDNAKILIEKSTELKATDKTLNNHFVDPMKISSFISYLENLGLKNNTKLVVKNIGISNHNKDTILVNVSVEGSFNNVIKILYLLESTPFNVNLTQTFVNKEIESTENNDTKTEIKNKKTKVSYKTSPWKANISFSVLSLPK